MKTRYADGLRVDRWALLAVATLFVGCGSGVVTRPPSAPIALGLLGVLHQAREAPQGRAPLVALAPDAGTLVLSAAFGTTEERLFVWSLPDEKLRWSADAAGIQSVHFGKDASRLISAHADGSVRVWNVLTGQMRRLDIKVPSMPNTIVYDAIFLTGNGQNSVAIAGQHGVVAIWEHTEQKWIFGEASHGGDVLQVVSFQSGARLLSVDEGQFCLWDTSVPGRLSRMECRRHDLEDPKSAREGRSAVYQNPLFNNLVMTLSPDEQVMMLAKDRGILQLWDVQSRMVLTSFQQSTHVPVGFFSQDGKWLIRFQQTHFFLENGQETVSPSLEIEDVHAYRRRSGELHFERRNTHQSVFRNKADHWVLGVRGWSMLERGEVGRVVVFDPAAPQGKVDLGPHVVNGVASVLSQELPPAPLHGWVKQAEPAPTAVASLRAAVVASSEVGPQGQPLWTVDPEKGVLRSGDGDAEAVTIQLDSLRGAQRIVVSPGKRHVLVLRAADAQLFEKQTKPRNKSKSKRKQVSILPAIRQVWQRSLAAPARYAGFAPRSPEILWATGSRLERIGMPKGNTLDALVIGEKDEIQMVDYDSRSGWVFVWTDHAVSWRAKTGRWRTRPGVVSHVSVHAAGLVLGGMEGKVVLVDPARNVDKATWVVPTGQEIDRVFLSARGGWAVVYSAKLNKMSLWQLGSKASLERGTFQLEEGDVPKQVRFLPGGRVVEWTLLSGKARWHLPTTSKKVGLSCTDGKSTGKVSTRGRPVAEVSVSVRTICVMET